MRKLFFILVTVCSLLFGSSFGFCGTLGINSQELSSDPRSYFSIETTENYIDISFKIPDTDVTFGENERTINIPGFNNYGFTGGPALPMVFIPVGLPADINPESVNLIIYADNTETY
ncbi:MAG: hypothetical protein GX444_10715 [Myxococcales bacterium]|nr:hypothetical protein [Myxococcales bacterium]